MNLPFVLDVAIGLIFIFLILSLLVSEIQELLTTIFQWRAKHLRDAIEILLSGGVGTIEEKQVRNLVDKLYDDPLLKNINQEAKGCAGKVRGITRWSILGNQRGAFGGNRTTGPSYISPETFATSLLERIGLADLAKKLIEVRLRKFATRIIGIYDVETKPREDGAEERITLPSSDEDKRLKELWKKGRVRLIAERANWRNLDQDKNFQLLVEEFDDILSDFENGEINLNTSVERMGESFSNYINNYVVLVSKDKEVQNRSSAQALLPVPSNVDLNYFSRRLQSFKISVFGEKSERAIMSGGLRPSLLEIAELLDQTTTTFKEVNESYQNLLAEGKLLDLSNLPNSVKESFVILARRAQTRVQHTGNDIHQFREEVAVWFDRSMSRASGVYKRNAKGVGILIGLLLVVATNVDAGFIVDRLSNNENLRNVIAERAATISQVEPSSNKLDEVRAQTKEALNELALPIGWNPANVADQLNCELINNQDNSFSGSSSDLHSKWDLPANWTEFYKSCLADQRNQSYTTQISNQSDQASTTPIQTFALTVNHLFRNLFLSAVKYPLAVIRIMFGWLIAAIAISMGAPFWFDLLGKIVNVRNSGGKPTSIENQSVAKSTSTEITMKRQS